MGSGTRDRSYKKMTYFYNCLGLVAPYYNMVLVVIVVILFLHLFREAKKRQIGKGKKNKIMHIKPWKFLFLGVCVYIVEEFTTILRSAELITLPAPTNAILETFIITSFIYMLLLQKKYVKNVKIPKK